MERSNVMTKYDLLKMVPEAISSLGGSATVLEVSREIWRRYEGELRASGDLFFVWQYEIRWAAYKLREDGVLAPTGRGASSRWVLMDV